MTDRVIVEADGGSRGNPGVAGYGALVRDAHTGRVLVERAAPLGKQSNNVAEYQGLIAGLGAAVEIAPGAAVEVKMDSKLVIEQMAGRWKVKHEDMRRLSLEAAALVRRIRAAGGSVSWTWIPRERNKAADKLSNDGMDGRTIDTLPSALTGAGLTATTTTATTATTTATPPSPPTDEPALDLFGASEAGVRPAPPTAATDTSRPGAPAATTGASRLLLVRHAATSHTDQGRVDGRGGSDPGLDATGRIQARALATVVRDLAGPGATLVTSSLARARQTGAVIGTALGVDAEVDADWDEQAFGDWDGRRFAELAADHPDDLDRLWTDPDFRRPGGESHSELTARVQAAFERATATPGTVVVVTSRKPVLVVLARALGVAPDRFWALSTDPASVSAVEVWPDGNVSVPFVNRTARLA